MIPTPEHPFVGLVFCFEGPASELARWEFFGARILAGGGEIHIGYKMIVPGKTTFLVTFPGSSFEQDSYSSDSDGASFLPWAGRKQWGGLLRKAGMQPELAKAIDTTVRAKFSIAAQNGASNHRSVLAEKDSNSIINSQSARLATSIKRASPSSLVELRRARHLNAGPYNRHRSSRRHYHACAKSEGREISSVVQAEDSGDVTMEGDEETWSASEAEEEMISQDDYDMEGEQDTIISEDITHFQHHLASGPTYNLSQDEIPTAMLYAPIVTIPAPLYTAPTPHLAPALPASLEIRNNDENEIDSMLGGATSDQVEAEEERITNAVSANSIAVPTSTIIQDQPAPKQPIRLVAPGRFTTWAAANADTSAPIAPTFAPQALQPAHMPAIPSHNNQIGEIAPETQPTTSMTAREKRMAERKARNEQYEAEQRADRLERIVRLLLDELNSAKATGNVAYEERIRNSAETARKQWGGRQQMMPETMLANIKAIERFDRANNRE